MNRDRVEGSIKQATGAVKEAVGKATGNRQLQSKGVAEKAGGRVQNAVGGVKDSLKPKAKN
jgi:uncharacterized protein YjbJ (UPF0337 family)